MTKKQRNFHPRQRGNKINTNKQRHLSKQHQPGQQSHETQASRPLQKKSIRRWFAERQILSPQGRSPLNQEVTRNAAIRQEPKICYFLRLLINN